MRTKVGHSGTLPGHFTGTCLNGWAKRDIAGTFYRDIHRDIGTNRDQNAGREAGHRDKSPLGDVPVSRYERRPERRAYP